MKFDYYHGAESEQFSFVKIPRLMLTSAVFAPLSIQAKLLYGVFLDRMGLSMRNGWFDEDNHVYIIYQISEIQDDLGFSKKKAIEFLAELEQFGLVEKKRRGRGLPSILYIKNFLIDEKCDFVTSGDGSEAQEVPTSVLQEVSKSAPLEVPKTTLLEVPKSTHLKNKTDINYNNINNNQSIYPSTEQASEERMDGLMDTVSACESDDLEMYQTYKHIIEDNVNYELFEYKNRKLDEAMESEQISAQEYEYEKNRYDLKIADKVIGYMLAVLCSKSTAPVRIGEELYARELVKKKLLQVEYLAFMKAVAELKMNERIKNPKGYAISMLYNG